MRLRCGFEWDRGASRKKVLPINIKMAGGLKCEATSVTAGRLSRKIADCEGDAAVGPIMQRSLFGGTRLVWNNRFVCQLIGSAERVVDPAHGCVSLDCGDRPVVVKRCADCDHTDDHSSRPGKKSEPALSPH